MYMREAHAEQNSRAAMNTTQSGNRRLSRRKDHTTQVAQPDHDKIMRKNVPRAPRNQPALSPTGHGCRVHCLDPVLSHQLEESPPCFAAGSRCFGDIPVAPP
jgi:hypothetical protein